MALEDYVFHEATIVNFSKINNSIFIELEDIGDEAGENVSGTLEFIGVENLYVNDIACQDIGMFYPDGEVISLTQRDNSIRLEVQWDDFRERKQEIMCYRFDIASVNLNIRCASDAAEDQVEENDLKRPRLR